MQAPRPNSSRSISILFHDRDTAPPSALPTFQLAHTCGAFAKRPPLHQGAYMRQRTPGKGLPATKYLVEPSIAGATTYCGIYASEEQSPTRSAGAQLTHAYGAFTQGSLCDKTNAGESFACYEVSRRAEYRRRNDAWRNLCKRGGEFCLLRSASLSRNFARLGAPRNGGDGVVTYVEPSIAGATTYCKIYASESSSGDVNFDAIS